MRAMKAQETWTWDLRPLLDEYVYALLEAERARLADEGTTWDRHTKRAALLADKLILTPEAKRRHGVGDGARPVDPFSELDRLDNVTPILPPRSRRGTGDRG